MGDVHLFKPLFVLQNATYHYQQKCIKHFTYQSNSIPLCGFVSIKKLEKSLMTN